MQCTMRVRGSAVLQRDAMLATLGLVCLAALVRPAAVQGGTHAPIGTHGAPDSPMAASGALPDAPERAASASGMVRATTPRPRRPCVCADGQCTCCSGFVMQSFVNVAPRQRGCIDVTYDPDDFAFAMKLSFNDRVLYKNTISAKNPRPLCVSVPRVTGAKMCVRLSNVYFVGRNLHACIDMEAKWQDSQAFQMTFDCIRVGADGVKVVKPEAGAGLAVGVPVGVTPAPDEYDEIPAEQPAEQVSAAPAAAAATAASASTTTSSAAATTAPTTEASDSEEET